MYISFVSLKHNKKDNLILRWQMSCFFAEKVEWIVLSKILAGLSYAKEKNKPRRVELHTVFKCSLSCVHTSQILAPQ
jgi:hypothetical protein